VWPLSRRASREVLRLGRVAAERWVEVRGGLRRVASQPVEAQAMDRWSALSSTIEALYASADAASDTTVVLESAWVPVMLADTGPSVWRRDEVEALLKHRFGLLYDEPADPVSAWDVRVDHHAGELRALAYAFSPRLRDALAQAARNTRREWAALTPAFAWAWQRSRPGASVHWALQEQDRMLLASFDAGRPVALNAAVPLHDGASELVQEVKRHEIRTGQGSVIHPVVAAVWKSPQELPAGAGPVTWLCLVSPDEARPAAPSTQKVAA